MDAGHWQRLKNILNEALEVEPAGRDEFLRSACGGSPTLEREVADLLSYESNDDGHLEMSAASTIVGPAAQIGRTIGRYRITGELGEGGMGAVYLGERADGEFEQKVAIKLIRRGLDTHSVVDRFVNERRILATLEHPNIARLIDGGTTEDAVPYFVMEYVDGVPILEHAREKGCNLAERLVLFTRICAAVAYAHRNLVIHRDLKPSNILITSDGEVKLLDFGIAKVLDPELSGDAHTQQYALTPEYASPEQLRGERLTTATDIYSLGVILYELLTGRRPLDTSGKNLGEVIKTVCETLPRRPSSVVSETGGKIRAPKRVHLSDSISKELRGDLDSIVLKSLRKEPSGRYSSVEEFAADIRRHSEGKPVTARNGVWSYRARKYIARNRVAVGAASIVFVTLVAGLVATLYQGRVARAERARAEKRFNDVRQLANSFVFEINDEIEKSPIRARALMVERAVQYLDSLSSEASDDDSLTAELASAYEKIGDVQSQIFDAGTGNAGDALVSQQKALELRTRLYERSPSDTQRALDLAKSYQKVGSMFKVTGSLDKAAEQFRRSIEVMKRLTADIPADESVRIVLANSYLLLGQAILRSGSLSDSLANYERSYAIMQGLITGDPRPEIERRLAVADEYIAYVDILMGRNADALQHSDHALDIDRRAAAADPQDQRLKRSVTDSVLWMGIALREAGQVDESIKLFNEAKALQQAILDADHENYGEKNSMADCWLELGLALDKKDERANTIAAFQKALVLYQEVAEHDKDDMSASAQTFRMERFLADQQLKLGNFKDAVTAYGRPLDGLVGLSARDPENLEWKYEVAECRLGLAKGYLRLHSTAALSFLEEARFAFEQLTAASPENIRFASALAETKELISFH